jgi:quercetin dioxygenase-like cupin family protein
MMTLTSGGGQRTVSQPSLAQGGVFAGKGQGKSFWLLTDLHTFKVTGADTGGAFVVAELTAGPEMGPPPHIHRNADESFYVLEGLFEFMLAGQTFTAGPGAFVHLPRGVVHTHKAAGGAAARAIVIQSPAGVEKFIEEAGKPATNLSARPAPPEMSELGRIVDIAKKHGIEVPTS